MKKIIRLLQILLKIKISNTLLSVTVASICFSLSAFIWWLSTPLQWKVNGYSIPLIGNPLSAIGFAKSFKLFSFGTAGISLFFLCILFYAIKPCRRFLFLVGLFGIALPIYFLLKFIFLNPASLNTILYQQDQYSNMLQFSQQFLINTNIAQSMQVEASFASTIDKIKYCFSFISIGFYTHLFGGLILITASRRFFQTGFKKILITALFFTTVFFIALCSNNIISEFYLLKADKHLFSGDPYKAIEYYKKAESFTPILKGNALYTYKLGYADYLNRNDSLSVHFFKGRTYQRIGNFRESLYEYNIAQADKNMKDFISKRKVNLLAVQGLKSYGEDENYRAISLFVDSVNIDPWQMQSHFFLIKAYLDIHRFNQYPTNVECQTILLLSGEKLLRADTYNLFGDSYYKSLGFIDARDMYTNSLKSFNLIRRIVNFNGIKGLQGL